MSAAAIGRGPVEKEITETTGSAPKQNSLNEQDVETGPEVINIDRIEKVYSKLDRRILPAFWVLYFLCSAIRSNIGLAQTMNLDKGHDLASELNLTPKQVSTGLALFYVCYVIFDMPSNLVMSRLSPHVWMSRIVTGVGIIGCCLTAMKAAWSFYLLRLLLGIVIAGMWPGMSYYLTLFYPPSRTGKRIGRYFTASQVSAAVVGLVSAGFQEMDGLGGLVGFQWMFLLYGLVGTLVGISLLWWLPDRPLPPGEVRERSAWLKWIPESKPALTGEDARIHYEDLTRVYRCSVWTMKDLWHVVIDWRLWPLVVMYFGVVGVGIGTQAYASVIIRGINPDLSGIDLSLLTAPIWIMDLIAILIFTPLSDRFHRHRAAFFSFAVLIQIGGLLMTTFGGGAKSWTRYGGLLLVGFGLGPTVPICMTWTNEIFQPRHGEVGVAAASALVSGLGNLGSILTTYALYTGWPEDAKGPHKYRKSNLVMIGILCGSILAAGTMVVLLRVFGEEKGRRVEMTLWMGRREERSSRGAWGECFGSGDDTQWASSSDQKRTSQSHTTPLVTYTINQNLAGKLTVTSSYPNAYAYSITLATKKAWRDTIEVAIHRSINSTYQQQADVVGSCLIQTRTAKFTKVTFDAYGQDIKLEKSSGALKGIEKSTYTLAIPPLNTTSQWSHDHTSVTDSARRLKLEDSASGAVLARFGGGHNMNEFGMLEVYDPRVAQDMDWCGLCILTAVCVFAREERVREMRKKANGVVGTVANWGGDC
ncbi:hypothetical protein N0V90_004631 [Kalmusia sp. IMI 367209]|nr:hypothetical protein N0V90_004631 [Kalmusia sp. IMI 367209]